MLVLSLRLHAYTHAHTFFFTLLSVIQSHMHACHALVGCTHSRMHTHNDFVLSLFFLLAFSAPFSDVFSFVFACVEMRVCVCLHLNECVCICVVCARMCLRAHLWS